MTRVAAVDCGTNSIRLLIADYVPGSGQAPGRLADVVREMRVVRLGQGVDATGGFAPEALKRTFAACEEYAALIRTHQAERVRFVATSATRDAANRDEFFSGVQQRLGVVPEVITGNEEAELSFTGAVAGLDGTVDQPVLVMDLGGGSTEIVLGQEAVEAGFSMDIGCVRMTERHLHSDPPVEAEIQAAQRDINDWYDRAVAQVPAGRARTLVGVAGTITTVAAGALELDRYDPEAIHGSTLSREQVIDTCTYLTGLPRAERAQLPFMHPGRVDVIGAGALVFKTLVQRICADVEADGGSLTIRVSETDILDGIALGIARGAEDLNG